MCVRDLFFVPFVQWSEPVDARTPSTAWRLYVFKGGESVNTLHIYRQSAYLVGRDAQVADLVVAHPSCSKQHAVIQFRLTEKKGVMAVRPYIMDLDSTNGTFLNGERIDPSKYIELLVIPTIAIATDRKEPLLKMKPDVLSVWGGVQQEKDMIKFGESTREYVLLHDRS